MSYGRRRTEPAGRLAARAGWNGPPVSRDSRDRGCRIQALTDTLFVVVLGLVVVAIAGDALAHFIGAITLPVCALLLALIAARVAWFYTSRW